MHPWGKRIFEYLRIIAYCARAQSSASPTADEALHQRRQSLQTYIHTLLRAPSVHATRNPYVLQLLGILPHIRPVVACAHTCMARPTV